MARKSAGEAVSIVGVSTFDNARAHAAEQREATTLAYAITCGSVYAHGLAYPVPGVLPAGDHGAGRRRGRQGLWRDERQARASVLDAPAPANRRHRRDRRREPGG